MHVRKEVLAQVELERGHEIVVASVNNLSLGGAFLLHSGDEVSIGETVRVHMAAGTVETVQAARVVRVSRATPPGFAVAWIEPTARTFSVIERLMSPESRSVIADAHPL